MKILIVQTAFIGDVILITPLIRSIKTKFPDSTIDVIVVPQSAGILTNNPHINSLIIFNKKSNKFLSFFKLIFKIRNVKYDYVFLPHSSLTSALLVFLAGIPIRIGFDRWISRKLLTHRVTHIKNVHKIEKYLNLLSPFSKEKFPIQTELFPSAKMLNEAYQHLQNLKQITKRIIAIAPGSIWFTKRWPEEYFVKLVKQITNLECGIVFIGSKDEKELCERIDPKINSINFAGELSILESAAIISNCDLMVCNDSGALHIANAVGTDVFAFFGPTVKRIGYYPFRENDKVLEVDLDCRPCGSHGADICPLEHHNCMKLIEPDFVLNEILDHFEGK